jgi:hypothetical protein
MAIVLKTNKVNLFVSSVLFVFWYHSPNILETPGILIYKPTSTLSSSHRRLPAVCPLRAAAPSGWLFIS